MALAPRSFARFVAASGVQTRSMASSAVVGFQGAVGNTPLIRLDSLKAATGCNIYAKAEFMNPGGSVKDRAALGIITAAEKAGLIKAGGTIVEGTAGNTGIGLAHICRAKGYKCVIYMPNTQSQEKVDTLRMLGAEVRLVPAVPFTDPTNYNHQARDFAAQLTNAVWTNQFDNTSNRDAHYETTGPEIWNQLDGNVHAFTCATGTAGTLAGVARFLQSKSPSVKIVLADPPGSVLHDWVQSKGATMQRQGSSITEGIGQGRITDNLAGTKLDFSVCVPDEVSVKMVYRLLADEGLLVGASSGLNVAAAVEVAKKLGPGHNIVTILCDSGSRYQTRLFNQAWLQSKGMWNAIPDDCKHFASAPKA